MLKYFAGIDVSLEAFNLCVLDTDGKVIKADKFTQTKEGFNNFLTALQNIATPENITIGIESSGNYHVNILSFLIVNHYPITLLNPLLVKNFHKSSTLRKTKTDKIDAKTIASFLRKHPEKIQNHQMHDPVKLLAREREAIAQEIAKIKTRVKQITFNIFKELGDKYNILTKTMLEFLFHVPSARIARELSEEKIEEIIKKISAGRGRKVKITAREVTVIVHNTISIDDENREEILRSLIRRLQQLEEELASITNGFVEKMNTQHTEPMDIITSLPGIGNLSAANFIAEVQTISTFNTHKKLIAYTGLDPIIIESGKFKGQSRISKRGNRHLRRIIWNMTMGVILYTHTFRNYYERKKTQKMKPKKAIIATANKLLRVLYTLLSRKIPFYDLRLVDSLPIIHS